MMRRTVLLLCACDAFLWAGVVTTQKGEVITTPRLSATPTRLLFAYATTLAGFDTEITISNTSQDNLGSVAQDGTCTLNLYGSGTPVTNTSVSIAAGKQLVFNLSQGGGGIPAAPNFGGYIAASCDFPLGRGVAKIYAAGHLAMSNEAQVITTPRSTAKPQSMLFPFVTNQAGFDTGIIISNTSSDPFGTTPSSGSCTLNFFGGTATNPGAPPGPVSTGTISSGFAYANVISSIAPGFQGYVIASCNFTGAAGFAFLSDAGARNIGLSESAELLATPRGSTITPLLFSSVTNQNGMDTGITIANTSLDPFGTTPSAGSCTLNFFGANAPGPVSTGNISAGSVYTNLASILAPGFQGYVIVSCPFPLSRGFAFTSPLGAKSDGDSEIPEMLTIPRGTTPAPLLFSSVTNWSGNDTNVTISNTSQDPFGTGQGSGTCAISYFGDMLGGGPAPSPHTSALIQAGGQLSFSLSQGNPGQGIPATPGFRGYVIAACNFPQARGLATISSSPSKAGIFRGGFFWILDQDGNQQFNSPPDRAFAFGGIPGDIPITGDWNGSGTSKVGVYRSSNGLFILDYDGDGQFTAADKVYNLGVGIQAGDVPVVGDWNGDGRTKIGIFRQGFFWILDTNGNGTFDPGTDSSFAFGGVAGDVPIVGDWNGSRTSKVGVFRGGFLWILDTNGNHALDAGDQVFPFGGIAGDVPVVGDWNGDGRTKVGVFRMGFFWVLDTNGNQVFDAGTDQAFAFGGITLDKPVVGKW